MMSEQVQEWPDDVPSVDEVADGELAALDALARERQRDVAQAPPPPTEWTPTNHFALAIWRMLPDDGGGVDYARTCQRLSYDQQIPMHIVQSAIAGLVLVGRVYVAPPSRERETGYALRTVGHSKHERPEARAEHDRSIIGRGFDPRVGAATVRVGAFDGVLP